MQLILKKVEDHPQATDAYRVIYEGVEVGSIGAQLGAGQRRFWSWGIDTVLPRQPFATHGEGIDRESAMAQFKVAWATFCTDPTRLAAFLDMKARAKR